MVSNNRNTQPAPLQQRGIPYSGDLEKINNFPKSPYPPVKVSLLDVSNSLPLLPYGSGMLKLKLMLNGCVTLKEQGEYNPLVFDRKGYEIEAKQRLGEFFSDITLFSVDMNKGAEINSAVAGEFCLTFIGFKQPNQYNFSISFPAINKIYHGWNVNSINGELTLTLVIEQEPAPSNPVIITINDQILLAGVGLLDAITASAETVVAAV